MKHVLLSLLLLLSFSAKGIEVTHGPWICDMDSTSVTIVWVTDKPGKSWVEIAPDGPDHSMVRLVLVIMIFLRDVRFSPIVFIVFILRV